MGQLQGLSNGLPAPVPPHQAPVHSKPATCFSGRPTVTGSFVLFLCAPPLSLPPLMEVCHLLFLSFKFLLHIHESPELL